jgi:outer membrane protein assembly factor BamB
MARMKHDLRSLRMCFTGMIGFVSAVIWVAASCAGDDWPQFRGPAGDGVSQSAGLPVTWSETNNVAWKVPIPGLGRSSPVVLGERVWITTAVKSPPPTQPAGTDVAQGDAGSPPASETLSLGLVCLDRASGKLLYHAEAFTVDRPAPIHGLNSYATPTPVAEPGRVYCDFGTFGTACLNSDTGRVLWRARLPVDHQLGPGSSPAVFRNWLLVVRDGCDAQYVAALDKATGKIAWKTERPPIQAEGPAFKKSFSTPLIVETGGRAQAIIIGPQWVVSYEPETGKEIWRVHHGKGYSIAPRPVFGHGMAYVCTGDYVAQLWAIHADGRGDVTESRVAWKATSQIPLMSSPILVAGQLYFVSDAGVISCLDALTGKLSWRERIGGNYAASPIYAGGRIYFFSREGKTTVLRPDKEFVRLAENRLAGTVIASPAISGDSIILRTDTHLYRLRNR